MKQYSDIQKRLVPRFSGIKTFFRCPWDKESLKTCEAVFFGVPFDGGTTYRSGGRMAPSRIREISSLGRGYHFTKERDVFERLKVADGGDAPVNPISLEKTYKSVEEFVFQISHGKKTLAVGGDHSITLPILRALHHRHGPLNLLHFDAHFDTYPSAFGSEYHHGTFLRHGVKEKLIKSAWQFGIRGPLVCKEDTQFVKENNISFFTVDDIKNKQKDILKDLPNLIKGPTYLSFDVDCLDPAYAPGTGTPVVGGLSSYEAQQILRNLKIENLVGADVVEVNPSYDHGDITSLIAVDVLFECLHLMIPD